MTSCFSSEFADLNEKKKSTTKTDLNKQRRGLVKNCGLFFFFFSLLLVKLTHVWDAEWWYCAGYWTRGDKRVLCTRCSGGHVQFASVFWRGFLFFFFCWGEFQQNRSFAFLLLNDKKRRLRWSLSIRSAAFLSFTLKKKNNNNNSNNLMTPFTFPFFDFHTICFDLCICSFLLQLVEFLLFSFSAVSVLTCFSFDEDTQTNTHTYTHTHTHQHSCTLCWCLSFTSAVFGKAKERQISAFEVFGIQILAFFFSVLCARCSTSSLPQWSFPSAATRAGRSWVTCMSSISCCLTKTIRRRRPWMLCTWSGTAAAAWSSRTLTL